MRVRQPSFSLRRLSSSRNDGARLQASIEMTPPGSHSIQATGSTLAAIAGFCGSGPSTPATVDTLAWRTFCVATTRATVARVVTSVRKVRGSVCVSITWPHTMTAIYLRVTTGSEVSKSNSTPPSSALK